MDFDQSGRNYFDPFLANHFSRNDFKYQEKSQFHIGEFTLNIQNGVAG